MSDRSTEAPSSFAMTMARISFFVLAIVAFVSILGLFDAMLATDYAIYGYLSGVNTVVLTTVLALIALIGLSGLLTNEANDTRTYSNETGLGLHLRLTEPRLSGRDVERVQALLHVLQFPVHIDGLYGAETAAAVRSFQSSMGLPADGVVEEGTLAAMDSQVASFGRANWVKQILAQNNVVPNGRTALPNAGSEPSLAGAD